MTTLPTSTPRLRLDLGPKGECWAKVHEGTVRVLSYDTPGWRFYDERLCHAYLEENRDAIVKAIEKQLSEKAVEGN